MFLIVLPFYCIQERSPSLGVSVLQVRSQLQQYVHQTYPPDVAGETQGSDIFVDGRQL